MRQGCPAYHNQAHLENRTEDQFHLSTLQPTERILRQRGGNISSHQNLPVSSNPIPTRDTKTSSNHQVGGDCLPEESGLSRCTNRMSVIQGWKLGEVCPQVSEASTGQTSKCCICSKDDKWQNKRSGRRKRPWLLTHSWPSKDYKYTVQYSWTLGSEGIA